MNYSAHLCIFCFYAGTPVSLKSKVSEQMIFSAYNKEQQAFTNTITGTLEATSVYGKTDYLKYGLPQEDGWSICLSGAQLGSEARHNSVFIVLLLCEVICTCGGPITALYLRKDAPEKPLCSNIRALQFLPQYTVDKNTHTHWTINKWRKSSSYTNSPRSFDTFSFQR